MTSPAETQAVDHEVWRAVYNAAATPGLQPHEVANKATAAIAELDQPAEVLRKAALEFATRHEYDDVVTKREVKAWLYERASELGRQE